MNADRESLLRIEGIGPVLAENFTAFFADGENRRKVLDLAGELQFEEEEAGSAGAAAGVFAGRTFVITGSLESFANRQEAQALIERLGGKAAGSVSAKTSYLINNDSLSSSSKNIKARELGVPIITEEEFLAMLPEGVRNV